MRNILIASVAALLAASSNAQAAEIKALITTAMDGAVVVLVPQFEKATGHKVTVSYDPSGGLARRLRGGEFADMILVASPELDKLIAEGKVVGNRIDVSRTGIGIAIRKGAPKPDVSTPEALKRTLLAAKTIGYSKLGASGTLFLQVAEKLGIGQEVKAKLVETNGVVGELIVEGKAEIGVQQIPELMAVPGVAIAGPLPGDLQVITTFSAAQSAKPQQAEAAKAFIQFLKGAAAQSAFKAKGLDPA